MAAFHIHEDCEKENPRIPLILKEKSLGPNIGGRPNFTVLHDKANNGHGHMTIGPANKVAFRDVGNVESRCETSSFFASAAAAAKKTVVEQFKTFSVYEDQPEIAAHQQRQHGITHPNTANNINNANKTDLIQTEKENICSGAQHHILEQDELIASSERDTANVDECILDTTPMSVSEVLSPMSIDRSQISGIQHSTSDNIGDDSDCKKVVDLVKEDHTRKHILPRNDRQRFFEVVDYQRNILEYFRESEQKNRPKPHYMRRQGDINHSMRTILVDWLVEVSEEYNLDTETLYLTVSYIDRFLSHMSVVRSKLQLVGTAAMYIASKYEEIYPPDVGEFVFITDDTYSKAQVLRMEQIILKILSFCLCTPTAFVFVNTYAVLVDMPDKLKFLTQYICELSLLEADPFLRYFPSLISAASHALARYTLHDTIWSPELEEVTTYRLEDLKEVLLFLCKSHCSATTLPQQAIQEKYKAEKYGKVSGIKPVELDEYVLDDLICKYNNVIASERVKREEKSTLATTEKNNDNVRRAFSLY